MVASPPGNVEWALVGGRETEVSLDLPRKATSQTGTGDGPNGL